MRTKTVSSVLILILIVASSCSALQTTSLEEKYFETRDHFIRQFERDTIPIDDRPALAELEKQIRPIVGPVKIAGFPKQGKLNLLTLKNEPGFAQVDGLRFDNGRETLFVTTVSLLKKYLAEYPELAQDVSRISKTGDFYRRVFHADAGVICFAEVPVIRRKGQSFVHAVLGVSAQDIVSVIPNEIFVFVSIGNRILLVNAPVAAEITDIPQCLSQWEKFNQKSAKAYELYKSTQLKNKKALAEYHLYREQGFEAYVRCFEEEANKQPFFPSLKNEAQAIVDRLRDNFIENIGAQ